VTFIYKTNIPTISELKLTKSCKLDKQPLPGYIVLHVLELQYDSMTLACHIQ